MFGVGVGVRVGGFTASSGGGFDPDAQAFFDRVTTAGGTLTTTEKNATNQLVLDMKSAGIWSAMRAVYPMVGASAAACAQNLKSSSFTGTFTSGWTFASTGATPNGTSAYMDTNFNPASNFSLTSLAFGGYTRTATNYDNGYNGANSPLFIHSFYGYNLAESFIATSYRAISGGIFGMMQNNLQGGNHKVYKNNTIASTIAATIATLVNANMFIGRANGIGGSFDNHEISYYYYSDGLTDTQASNFYTAVQAFQTTLSRQV